MSYTCIYFPHLFVEANVRKLRPLHHLLLAEGLVLGTAIPSTGLAIRQIAFRDEKGDEKGIV